MKTIRLAIVLASVLLASCAAESDRKRLLKERFDAEIQPGRMLQDLERVASSLELPLVCRSADEFRAETNVSNLVPVPAAGATTRCTVLVREVDGRGAGYGYAYVFDVNVAGTIVFIGISPAHPGV